ncbi:MAG: transglutaminase domain-containing protein, partial [Sinomicrobium sp.]|nr:transglutaminase domain-containing protein [Sinomicrobium sp.]
FDGVKRKYTESWKDADKKLKAEDIGKQSGKESNFRKLIPENIRAMSNDLGRAKAIYSYLQERMVWNEKYHIFRDVDVKRAFEERTGSAAELNLVLLNMLKAAGFKAYFMLVSTRDNGVATRLFPVISEFNYLVVKLDLGEKTYLLDITDKTLPFGMLPFKALNSYGRVMDFDEGSYWYDITAGKLSLNTNYVEYRVDAEGNISANMIDTNSDYLAALKRSELSELSQEAYLNAIEDDLGKASDAEITKYEIAKKDDLDDPVRETFSFNLGKNATGDLIYIYPFIYNKHKENPFKLNIRSYPVDFGYPFGYNHKIIIKADPAYEIMEIPKPRRYTMGEDRASLVMESYSSNNEISVDLTFIIRKSFFTPNEYRELKDLFGELVNIQNNLPIVLKKKE